MLMVTKNRYLKQCAEQLVACYRRREEDLVSRALGRAALHSVQTASNSLLHLALPSPFPSPRSWPFNGQEMSAAVKFYSQKYKLSRYCASFFIIQTNQFNYLTVFYNSVSLRTVAFINMERVSFVTSTCIRLSGTEGFYVVTLPEYLGLSSFTVIFLIYYTTKYC